MTNDLKGFAKRIRARGIEVEVNAQEAVRNTSSRISQSLTMEDTPVKSGQARNNWVASVGTPVTETVKADQYDMTGAERHGMNNEAISRQRPGQPVYITNNLPYIKRLNEGWSQQAPSGFVEAAIQKAAAFIRKARLLGTKRRGGW